MGLPVLILQSSNRIALVQRNLMDTFSHSKGIDVVLKDTVIPEQMIVRHTLAKSNWDWLDRRILKTAYRKSDYPTEGEIACTLSHRRVLEHALRNGHKQALILEDDAKPIKEESVASQLVNILQAMRSNAEWDVVQFGRCWDIQCHKRMKQCQLLSH